MGNNYLKSILGVELYEAQKEVFKNIQDNLKKKSKDLAEDVYVVQKEIMKDVIDEVEDKAKSYIKALAYKNYENLCRYISNNFWFIGKIVADKLRANKKVILDKLFKE